MERTKFINDWVKNDDNEPHVFWIGAFFYPRKLLTAMLQKYARMHSEPIDMVQFSSEILDEFNGKDLPDLSNNNNSSAEDHNVNSSSIVYYIRGLFLEGAQWDVGDRLLKDAKPKELLSALPIVKLKAHTTSAVNPGSTTPTGSAVPSQASSTGSATAPAPFINSNSSGKDEKNSYSCPVYITATRDGMLLRYCVLL
jgi:hypothetical protein